jgi:hypothetical protein
MNEYPKRIWLDSDGAAWKQYSEDDTPYIREDIVDGLVDALEELMYACTDKAESMAEAALKKLEEE